MTVSVDIKPELEAQFAARASSVGQSLEDFLRCLLEREASVAETNGSSRLIGAQKARAFRAWAKSFPPDLPTLSLESISRENMYRRD